jgi:outer membrane protein assembly factor BamB
LSQTFGRIAAVIFGFAAASTVLPPFISQADAQTPRYELSAGVTLDEVDSLVKGQLERAKALVENRRWDEAVETLRAASEMSGDRVVAVAPGYYVRLRDYCHRRLAALPAEALSVYREQVDPQAKRWLEQGIAERDDSRLRAIVDQFYCSSSTDEALIRLGESALSKADYGAARGYWEQLIEVPPRVIAEDDFAALRSNPQLPADLAALVDRYYVRMSPRPNYELVTPRIVDPDILKLGTALRERGIGGARLAYPRPDIAPADVFARLILTWIFDDSAAWAERGLRDYAAAFPDARGRLGGREVNYVEGLTALLAESREWNRERRTDEWTTFGGNPARNGAARRPVELGQVAWMYDKLSPVEGHEQRPRRVADDRTAPLSFHPVVSGNQVFVHDGRSIHALALDTGVPLWTHSFERTEGTGFNDRFTTGSRPVVGVPRNTLTVHRRRLLARGGDHVTAGGAEPSRSGRSEIVCLNLDNDGSIVWRAQPPEDRSAFEGSPLADDERVYVAIRKGGVRPQIQIACYDLDAANEGRLLWRRLICSAESPGQGQMDEITHTLLTLAGDAVYVNTNLGAVAALEKHSGAIRWVATYPRAVAHDVNRRTTHFYRDLNPCVYDRGTIYAAPSDSRYILAFESAGGRLAWETHVADDVVNLLGVHGDHLMASGDSLWWINVVKDGKVELVWPEGSPRGYGRGFLAGNQALWPTRTSIYTFDSDHPGAGEPTDLAARNDRVRQAIQEARDRNNEDADRPIPALTGGNLVPAGKLVLIATGNTLFAVNRRDVDAEPSTAAPTKATTTTNGLDVSDQPEAAR